MISTRMQSPRQTVYLFNSEISFSEPLTFEHKILMYFTLGLYCQRHQAELVERVSGFLCMPSFYEKKVTMFRSLY